MSNSNKRTQNSSHKLAHSRGTGSIDSILLDFELKKIKWDEATQQIQSLIDKSREEGEEIGRQYSLHAALKKYLAGEKLDALTMVKGFANIFIAVMCIDTNADTAIITLKDLEVGGKNTGDWEVTARHKKGSEGTKSSKSQVSNKFEVGDIVWMKAKFGLGFQAWTGTVVSVKKGWAGYKYYIEWTVNGDFGQYVTHGWRPEGVSGDLT